MQIDQSLIEKFLAGQCSHEEAALVIHFLENTKHHDGFLSFDEWEKYIPGEPIDAALSQKLYASVLMHIKKNKSVKLWPLFTAAAVLLAISGLFFVLFNIKHSQSDRLTEKSQIKPGGPQALLTLSDGKQVVLNDLKVGNSLQQAGIKVTKTANGILAYAVDAGPSHQAIAYNTIATPPGGTYQVELPDGSKVWLNSTSSLRYPVRFTGSERKVDLTGEGYFEIKHESKRPFRVVTGVQTIEVLGTHFNINAYADEPMLTTTLLEGRIKINAFGKQKILKPSEQAKLKGNDFEIRHVAAEDAVDWVENDFVFDDEPLESIMRKLSRWYNIEAVCPQELAKQTFSGSISRNKSLVQVLGTMERTGLVHFKITGRRVSAM